MTMLDSLQNEQLKKLLRHPDMRLEEKAEIPDRLKCICCHKLLLRAMQTPCGCKICSDCFSEYIGHQNSVKCPTNQPDCQEEMLTKDNVHPDNATNKEILRLKVNCPYAGCKEVDTVQTIHSQHMDVCDRRSIKCEQCFEAIVLFVKPDHVQSHMPSMKSKESDLCSKFLIPESTNYVITPTSINISLNLCSGSRSLFWDKWENFTVGINFYRETYFWVRIAEDASFTHLKIKNVCVNLKGKKEMKIYLSFKQFVIGGLVYTTHYSFDRDRLLEKFFKDQYLKVIFALDYK